MGRDVMDRHRSLRVLVGLIITVIAFYIIGVVWGVLAAFGDIILLFFLAWIITFVLEPVSTFLVNRRIPRLVAVSLIYLALLIVISGVIVLSLPAIETQVLSISNEIKATLTSGKLSSLTSLAVTLLHRVGFSSVAAQNLVDQVAKQIPARTGDFTNQAVTAAAGIATSTLTVLFEASLVLILSFYFMIDGGKLIERIIEKIPPVWVPDIRLFQRHVDEIFGGFIRAQLIVAFVYGAFTWIILFALGLSSGAIIASLLAGAIMILPFIGSFLSIVPPALLVLLETPSNEIATKLILVVVLSAAAQHVVLNLLAPRIFGSYLGVDPIILFAILLLGAKEGGVWGAFFAGPVAAVIYAMIETFYDRFRETSDIFQQEPDPAAIAMAEGRTAFAITREADLPPGERTKQPPRPQPRVSLFRKVLTILRHRRHETPPAAPSASPPDVGEAGLHAPTSPQADRATAEREDAQPAAASAGRESSGPE